MIVRLAPRLVKYRRAVIGACPAPAPLDSDIEETPTEEAIIDLDHTKTDHTKTDHGVMTPRLADLAR